MTKCTTTIDGYSPTLDRAPLAMVKAGAALMAVGVVAALSALVVVLSDRLLDTLERDAQRRHLMSLDDPALKDIGLSRSDLDRLTR